MVYADLHVHTDHSDGQMNLTEVPGAARGAGVEVVAVTDHDRVHPDIEAPVVVFPREGDPVPVSPDRALPDDPEDPGDSEDPDDRDDENAITVIRGIELRVEAGDRRVDLLGYGLERTPEIEATIQQIQADRRERGRAIIECIADRLGISLPIEPRPGLGRPHVARAVDRHPETDLDYQATFEQLIARDGPCYVERTIPSFEEGRRVLADACDVVSLAHPLRYDDPAAALSLTADLDAVEQYYPYDRDVDLAPVDGAIAEHDLLATGGSDAHDDRLGRAGLDRDDFGRVWASLRDSYNVGHS